MIWFQMKQQFLYQTILLYFVTLVATLVNATEITLTEDPAPPEQRHYNLLIGDAAFGMTGHMSLQWSDNTHYAGSSSRASSSWVFVPSLSLDMYWPVNPYVRIDSGLTFGYRYYSDSTEFNDFFINGSGGQVAAHVAGQIMVGDDSVIVVRNRLWREVDSLDIAARDYGDNYTVTRNELSLSYSKRLNRNLTGTAKYAHTNLWTSSSTFDYQDNVSDSIDLLLMQRIRPNLSVGPYVRWESVRFTEKERNDREILEFGLATNGSFVFGSVVTFSGHIGYETLFVDTSNSPSARDDEGGFKADFQIGVRPILFPGHRVRFAYTRNHETLNPAINYSDEFLVGYGLDFIFTDNWRVSADIDWLDIRESDGGEHANLWRYWMRTDYMLTPKTSIGAGYRYTTKSSDEGGRGYSQNTFEVNLSHRF